MLYNTLLRQIDKVNITLLALYGSRLPLSPTRPLEKT